jgi:hypothetical protein
VPDLRVFCQALGSFITLFAGLPKNELVSMGQNYSPVFDIVSNGVPVTVGLENA